MAAIGSGTATIPAGAPVVTVTCHRFPVRLLAGRRPAVRPGTRMRTPRLGIPAPTPGYPLAPPRRPIRCAAISGGMARPYGCSTAPPGWTGGEAGGGGATYGPI